MGKITDIVQLLEQFKNLLNYDSTNKCLILADIQVFRLDYGNLIMLSIVGDAVRFKSPIEAYSQFCIDSKDTNPAFINDEDYDTRPDITMMKFENLLREFGKCIIHYTAPVNYFRYNNFIYRQKVSEYYSLHRNDPGDSWREFATDVLIQYLETSVHPYLNEAVGYAIDLHLDMALGPDLTSIVMSYVM